MKASVGADLMGQRANIKAAGEMGGSLNEEEDVGANVKSRVDFIVMEYVGPGQDSEWQGKIQILCHKYTQMEWQMQFPHSLLDQHGKQKHQQSQHSASKNTEVATHVMHQKRNPDPFLGPVEEEANGIL